MVEFNGEQYEGNRLAVSRGLIYVDGQCVGAVDPDKWIVIISPDPVTLEDCDQNLVIAGDCMANIINAAANLTIENIRATSLDIHSYKAIHAENINTQVFNTSSRVDVEKLNCPVLNGKMYRNDD